MPDFIDEVFPDYSEEDREAQNVYKRELRRRTA